MTAERLDWQNMNELHILNVGRADCVVMLLDTPQGRKSVVMDAGGCTFQDKTPLLSFLREREVHTIVLAVLTHLHQDHFGGFFQLIGQIPVKKLLTPCGDLVFDERVYPIFGDREYYREYIRSSPAGKLWNRAVRSGGVCREGVLLRGLRLTVPVYEYP